MYLKNRKRAALVCQVRSSIRCFPELPYQEIIAVFKGARPLTQDIYCYFYGFFEECSPKLIKRFMEEENISRTQIVDIFDSLPELGEKYFLFEECMIDSLIRIGSKDAGLYNCRECTVANIRNEDLLNVVFCPLMMKRDLVK